MGNSASKSVGKLQINALSSCSSNSWKESVQQKECTHVVSVSSFSVHDANLVLFPEETFQFHYLLSLDLSNNQIASIPTQICQLNNLTKLVLMRNSISFIPETISQLTNLTFMEVSYNLLQEIPISLQKLTKLTGLGLSANRITIFPEELCSSLTELTQLGLHSNQITQLPSNLHFMKKLKKFDACRNRISTIPEGFCQLESLEWCNLSHNRIQQLPATMYRLQNLQEIGLAHNQIACIRPLKGLQNLTNLIIYDNKICVLCGETVASLERLQVLEAGQNSIEVIPYQLWDSLALRRVNLQYNSIRKIRTSLCTLNSQICSLMLQGNHLEYLPIELISIITSCQTFSLAYNPWLREIPQRRVLFSSLREAALDKLLEYKMPTNPIPKTCQKSIENAKKCIHCKLLRTSEMHLFFKFYNFSQFGAIPFVGYTCCE
jgi:Leucine-rich repeat (LRR) protein